ncbi:pimeloyl-ACP methyl ester carboxylesterase [Kribbella pratensis]|uniref:Pimeloyl-ACP methyl ester carboxylesterase n=1 Tax=Kribbella pratensis TaxID=2512112 RepID=A0ABY2FH03_9ACTN|nr:alpha/beta hydrolase [Kribbella pratensis]TDW90523.1 pimeloyl-ACP methyl ester carboxylesterase [Kribbella pratensis]
MTIHARQPFSRRRFVGTAAAATGASLLGGLTTSTASATPQRVADLAGSVSTAPKLPSGFTRTFKSRFVEANGIRQHVVVGGDGPPLLLVHGWPENWYAWRFLMPALAHDFTVVAVDQRGIGLTDKPRGGYDAATLANDLAGLMTALGHERFAVVGHDTGYIIGYALAADHRDRVERLVVAEVPGPPGVVDPAGPPPPPLFLPEFLNNRLWHIPFNRVDDELIVDMVRTNASAFYRYEFAIQGGGSTLPDYAIDYYVGLYNRDRSSLRATFGLYRAWDATLEQNAKRQTDKLTIPVLGIGGENSWGPAAAGGIAPAVENVQGLVIPGVGHWVAEQAPAAMLEAIGAFLAPYRTAAR